MFNNSISLVGKRNKICPLERQGRCKVPFAACGGAKREVERGHPAPRKGTAVSLTPLSASQDPHYNPSLWPLYNYLIAEFVIAWIAKRAVKKAVDSVCYTIACASRSLSCTIQ